MLLLGCICFPAFSSVKAYAAEPSPDAANQWYLLPFDTYTDGTTGVDGTWSDSSGTYNASKSFSTKIQWPQWTCSNNIGGVFPYLQAGKTYAIYFTFTAFSTVTGGFQPVNSLVLRPDYDDPSNSFYGSKISSNVTVVDNKDTATWTGIYTFSPTTDIALSTASAIFAKMPAKDLTVKGRVSWAFYVLDVTGMGENEIVAAINAQTQVIQQGQQQEQQRYDDFTQGGDSSEFDSAKDQVEGKIGIFTALDEMLQGVFGVFTAGTSDAADITFPAFSLTVEGESYDVWAEQTVSLDDMFTGPLAALKTALNFATVAAVYYALIRYLIRVYDEIFGGGGDS